MTKDFEKALCDGKSPGKLYPVKDEQETTAYEMWVMDAEYDPVHIVFDADGIAEIKTETMSYLMLHAEQLRLLADKADKAQKKLMK